MKKILSIEEAAMFGFSIFLFNQQDFAWWWYLALILTPDIGMLGYLGNPKLGAFTYNLFHHKAVGIVILITGYIVKDQTVILIGVILFGHSSLDRIFGYGLKYTDSFQNTHLGQLPDPKHQ